MGPDPTEEAVEDVFNVVWRDTTAIILDSYRSSIVSLIDRHDDCTAVGEVTKSQVRAIAEKKMVDLNAFDTEMAMRMIEGTARSMGIDVVEG